MAKKRTFKVESSFDETKEATETVEEPIKENPEKVEQFATVDDLFKGYKSAPMEVDPIVTESQEQTNENPDLSDPKKYYQSGPKKGEPKTGRPKQLKGMYVTGAILLVMTDLLLPIGIAFIHNRFAGKENKIKALDIKLTPDQTLELRPMADEVAQYLNLYLNPVMLYGLTLTGFYYANLIKYKTEKL